MATTIGAGKYVFGEDIPLGKYNLKALSGSGRLKIQVQYYADCDDWDEEWMDFGIEEYCAKSYHGLTLPKGKYFEVTGNVTLEISKSSILIID